MNRGLYAAPGDCATARAAETARRFAAPTTKVSKRERVSSGMLSATPGLGGRRQALEHELGDATQRLEDAHAMQRVRREARHTAKVQRLIEIVHRHDHVARKILLVVLKDERHRARIHPLIAKIRVQVLEALDVLVQLS